jgi:general secretion pathway protein D
MANIYGSGGFQAPLPPAPVNSVAEHKVAPNGISQVLTQQTGGGITTGGNRGGTSSADFDGLIELITKTIEPESWDEVGGPGSMKPSASNLSLVITQTQDVHERIADLLDQLRRLQDLQVTIEVRFITLSDNFFERIGVDFDFNIRSNATAADVARADSGVRMRPSATLGLLPPAPGNPFPNFTGNGEIPFSQDSFTSSIPPFGGFNPASAASFGIAILSDLEAFFLVQAAQGDARTNVMQAPKVTLFNGQAASISDQSQTPFVTSVTPVVGDFAAAQAPVIVVLNEGTTLSVQAVVSQDRRFVRLTLIPFFSQIKDVKEFQFTGSTTTKTSSANTSQDMGDNTSDADTSEVTREGTTIQLPTFVFTTVTTTVSVPDGGTVLLGGIKRLREGRNEFGVPIMSKIPYINRLFKNVGIGREAQSLMLMVTPRIIIQEEEEDKLGLSIPEEASMQRRSVNR